MKLFVGTLVVAGLAGVLALTGCTSPSVATQAPAATQAAVGKNAADLSGALNPYADNNGDVLPPGYAGPRYRLNHAYPVSVPPAPGEPAWREALGGKPIGKYNAIPYVQALKTAIAGDVRNLIDDYTKWDPIAAGWYDQPWIAIKSENWPGREPVQGSYPGPGFDKTTYPDLKVDFMQDYAIVYYNKTAAVTLHELWQKPNPYAPQPAGAQFAEGSMIIKLAVTTVSGKDWAPMQGTSRSTIFVPPPTASNPSPAVPPQLIPVYTLQMDIIVKDAATAPKTGWVFSTLVYDKDAAGATTWDKMVPLGAAWGNDPGVNDNNLNETVVNPVAPAYSKITLGWGGRLSGPNDAATQPGPNPGDPLQGISSCMSCHGAAEYQALAGLVPLPNAPGSAAWNEWFQDRAGNVPQTSGQTALDYDLVTRQALINWDAARGSAPAKERAARQLQLLRSRGKRTVR
ncbi:MAG: hypothetical protein JWN34_4008 [Bryobacterales bacterium]|nr:hypothetical protein [Bryobacterales bacterium]